LKIGTYENIAIAKKTTPIIQVINMFVENHISSVPIVDDENVVLNVYETVDVMVSMDNHTLWGFRVNAHGMLFYRVSQNPANTMNWMCLLAWH
jgi:CBS domain-containing protein